VYAATLASSATARHATRGNPDTRAGDQKKKTTITCWGLLDRKLQTQYPCKDYETSRETKMPFVYRFIAATQSLTKC